MSLVTHNSHDVNLSQQSELLDTQWSVFQKQLSLAQGANRCDDEQLIPFSADRQFRPGQANSTWKSKGKKYV